MVPIFLLLAAAEAPQRAPRPVLPDPCVTPERPGPYYLFVAQAPARQGATVAIRAMQGYPYNAGEADPKCVRKWKVSNPRAARIARDRKSVVIAPRARPGEIVTISYEAGGERHSGILKVVAASAVLLNGTRRQTALENCQRDLVGELEFGEKGFSVTYQPFESYKDYWGSYRFDPRTGALKMHVEGGNFVPPQLDLDGTARFEGNTLVLDGIDLGGRSAPPLPPGMAPETCRYRF